jgi:hypothetical protein
LRRTVAQARGDATFPAHLAPAGDATARIGYRAHRWHTKGRINNKLGEGGEGWEGSGAREEAGWLACGAWSSLSSVRPNDAFLTNAMDQLPNPVWIVYEPILVLLSSRSTILIAVLRTGAAGTKQRLAGTSRPMTVRVLSCSLACPASHANIVPCP